MGFVGTYKAVKILQRDENGIVFKDVDEVLANTTDDGMKHTIEQTVRTLIIVDENANINRAMEIPEGTPAEQIEGAKQHGMSVSADGKYMITKTEQGKVEDGVLYLYDAGKLLNGEEWVKISTDNDGELNMISAIYKMI